MWGRVLAGRYELAEQLGEGAQGRVFAARDLRTREELAVKLLVPRTPSAFEKARSEVLSLRWLRLPGVVGLLDEGWDGEEYFIAMERIDGQPFPSTPTPWEQLQPLALELLQILHTVHEAGVVHRDLKPSNVLVHAGRVHLVDFGLTAGLSPEARGEGTPRWMSPEQTLGQPSTPRSDLYSAAVLLKDALGEAPPWVPVVLEAMSHPLEQSRLPDAERARRALGGELPDLGPLRDRMVRGEEIVAGPRTFFHVPEGAERLLDQRCGQDVEARLDELQRWIRLGRARLERDHVRLGPGDLSGLRRQGSSLEEAAGIGDDALVRGDWSVALPALGMALAQARSERRDTLDLLARLSLGALAQESAAPLEEALCEVERSLAHGEPAQDLAALLQQVQLLLRGEPARALALDPAPFEDEELEGWRHAARLWALWWRGEGEDELERLRPWAEVRPSRLARWQSWRGVFHYRAGAYELALASHESSYQGSVRPLRRLVAAVNAASAALEACLLEPARLWAERGREAARRLGHAKFEALTTLHLGSVDYREGSSRPLASDHLSSAALMSPSVHLRFCLQEAGFALRRGDRDQVLDLAWRGRRAARSFGFSDAITLLDCLEASQRARAPWGLT